MSKIVVITAADIKFKEMALLTELSAKNLGYKTFVYDLGGLEYGIPFEAKISVQRGAKIPSKPSIIKHAINLVDHNDIVCWLDADALLWQPINELLQCPFDIAVTVRLQKDEDHDLPINAGVVFVRKTKNVEPFLDLWINKCSSGVSDQVELNNLLNVSTRDVDKSFIKHDIKIKLLPCSVYNNFYFKKPQILAKIIHYISNHRSWWLRQTIKKIPKHPSLEIINLNTISMYYHIANKGQLGDKIG